MIVVRLSAVRDVPGGRITINVAFAGTPIYEEVDDLCSKTTCPIVQGPINIQYTQDLPPIAPPVRLCASLLIAMFTSLVGPGVSGRACTHLPRSDADVILGCVIWHINHPMPIIVAVVYLLAWLAHTT